VAAVLSAASALAYANKEMPGHGIDYHKEGFIHCYTDKQLTGVMERYFKGKTGLVLLQLDESRLTAELKFEISTNDEMFPHIYGAINRDSIFKVMAI